MPLLGKKIFVRQKPPADLKPDEELFYCKLTHEVFREYEEFFERVILCNSLVWTCSYTGRPGLTYQESLDSERRARRFLKKFPSPLKQPILFIATLTERGRLNDMCDDVYIFAKDRYFVGENVEVTHYGTTRSCEITKIILSEKDPKSPVKAEVNGNFKPRRKKCINPSKVKYEVLELEKKSKTVVKAQSVSRPKGSYTRERNKLYLKQHTRCKNGVWKVKDDIIDKAGLEGLEFRDIFVGEKPLFQSSPTKKKGTNSAEKKNVIDKKSLESGKKNLQGKLNFKKETSEEKKTTGNAQQSANLKSVVEKEEQVKKQVEDEKTRIKELKIKEREKRKEEKRLWTEYMNEWKKPRDDLECDDLKYLPNPTPVDCSIPQNVFGDAIMILEFLSTFEKLLNVKNSFPRGFNFELLQKVLTETDIQGPLNDLVQLLLVAIFQLQDADDEEWKEKECYDKISTFDDQNVTISKAMNLACAAVSWPSIYHGTILRKMPLDPFSVTEILRMHLLASGSHEKSIYFDQACLPEDPGLWFKIEEPHLLKKLATTSIFQLSAEERIKILKVFVHQLLSCSSVRNLIEENQISLRTLMIQLRHLKAGYARNLRQVAGKSPVGRPSKVRQGEKGKIEAVNGVTNSDVEKIPEEEEDDDVNDLPLNGDSQKDIADGDSVNGSLGEEQLDEDKTDVESLTPEQIQEREEKKTKELARLKQDFHRKEREILENIKRHQSFCFLEPIGRDRAYRRYWVFSTVPGVFVEDEDHFVGKCPLTKVIPQISDLFTVLSEDDVPPSYVKKHLQQLNDCRIKASNKENDLKLGLSVVVIDSASPLKVRTDLNPRVDLKKGGLEAAQNEEQACLLCKDLTVKDVNGSIIKHCPHVKNMQPFGVCTFSVETCPVHNVKNNNRTKWAFFYKPEDVESLLLNLNPRGFREASLRKVILRDKETLLTSVSKCPYSNLNISLPVPQPEVRKSLRKQNIRNSEFADMNPEEALELTFRDTLLDLEENIYVGGLGSLKVPNRETWRISINQRGYDMQCENLRLGPESKTDENDFCGEENEADDMFKSSVAAKKAVKDMACALLQVSCSIEPKYLTPPLRETEAYKVIKQRVLDKIAAWESQKYPKRDCPSVPMPPLERWQKALVECTSFSQLFVHLSTLERSVAWSRSVLKAYCRTCKRKGDAENMLLCDGCDRGHHLYCLKPPLEKIPEGDWFCRVCKPPEKAIVTRRARCTESSDEEESYEESEQEQSDEVEEEEEEDTEDEDEMQNTCEICDKEDRHRKAGILVHCASCKAAYHRKCLNLSEAPKGKWFCRKCQKRKPKAKSTSWSFSSRRRDAQTCSNHSSSTSKRRAKFQRNEWSASRRKEALDQSDSEQSSSALRNRSRLQEKKRARSDSLDVEEMPAKRFCRGKGQDRRESSEVEENPFKKVYKDTAKNNERRRSKSRNGDDSLDYKSCLDLLVELIKHPSSWPFLVPVNKKNAPNYHQIIKRPMDFGTIRTKLNNMSYRNNNDFVLDVYLVLQNCELFNPQSSPEYKAAKTLGKFVASLLKSYDIYNPFDSKGRKALDQSLH